MFVDHDPDAALISGGELDKVSGSSDSDGICFAEFACDPIRIGLIVASEGCRDGVPYDAALSVGRS